MAGAPQKVHGPALEDKQHGRGSEENRSPSSQCEEASASTSEDEVRVTQRAAARLVSRLRGTGCSLFVHTSGDNTLTSI